MRSDNIVSEMADQFFIRTNDEERSRLFLTKFLVKQTEEALSSQEIALLDQADQVGDILTY